MAGSQSLNDILQLAGVAVALILCVAYIVRRVASRKRPKGCSSDCSGCPLADKCKNPDGGDKGSSCGCH